MQLTFVTRGTTTDSRIVHSPASRAPDRVTILGQLLYVLGHDVLVVVAHSELVWDPSPLRRCARDLPLLLTRFVVRHSKQVSHTKQIQMVIQTYMFDSW